MVVKKGKIKGMSLHIMPFSEIKELSIPARVKKILNLVLGNKVVILQGRLRAEEEIRLIEDTMAMVDHIKDFRGIELSVIDPHSEQTSLMFKFRKNLARRLMGADNSLTVIGPAAIVKQIKQDPKKLEVFFSNR
jgi:hypothetical protein